MTDNPFAPPKTDQLEPPPSEPPARFKQRLKARFADNFLILMMAYLPPIAFAPRNDLAGVLLFLGGWVPAIVFQSWLVADRGASIGKLALKLRVVDRHGQNLTRGRAIAREILAFFALSPIYDRIAGTKVIGPEEPRPER